MDASVIIAGIALVVSLAMGGLGYATITASRRAGGFQADALPADVQAIIDKMRDEMQTRHDQEMAALRAHYEMMLASNQHKIEELEARVDWLYSQLTGAGGKMPPRESVKLESRPSVVLGVWPSSDLNVRAEIDAIFRSGVRYSVLDSNVTKARLLSTVERTKPDILHVGAHADREGVYLDDGIALVGWWRNIAQIHPFRLVVLNACESLEVVEAMYDGGALSVVGMSKEIADTVAVAFTREFYDHLLRGLSVDDSAFRAKLTLAHTDAEMIKALGDWRVNR